MGTPMTVSHGAYARKAIYEIVQHKYVAGGHPGCGGYMELLEVKNPPNGRYGIIIHEHFSHANSNEFHFAEWQSLREALEAFERWWGWTDPFARFSKAPGFVRTVDCGSQTPWFYAKEHVPGDYVPLEGWLF